MRRVAGCVAALVALTTGTAGADQDPAIMAGKPVVYQVMTRLFGNTNTTNRPWGTREENGVGKFSDFTDTALASIRDLGVTHVWYTGVPHHALVGDYSTIGVSDDDPDVVKGRAGSPYAVKDYYSVNPDLADDPARRLAEFKALIDRTHAHGMQVIIDIVPNHVARRYESLAAPEGARDFGADDDTSVEWTRDNDFYYVVGEAFRVPDHDDGYRPLGGEPHPLSDGQFDESPAKWTGNGARTAQPAPGDWYETVKVNFGVHPDGQHDFDEPDAAFRALGDAEHAAFWEGRDVPASWEKFRDIALYWTELGVDGFRFDMAEMVPVAFWSYLNSAIRQANPDAFLLAEIYQPDRYRDYLELGRTGYLYDKVGLYDQLRLVVQGEANTDSLPGVIEPLEDIAPQLLDFLENHDEQRIASPAFAGNPRRALPAMVVSALLRSGPVMLYFGQEVGEPGDGDAGFGDPTRTTIFDYWGVPAHQRWMNGGAFDGGRSTVQERALREDYRRLLNFAARNPAIAGEGQLLHTHNREHGHGYDASLFAFARWSEDERLVVVSNFSADTPAHATLALPPALIKSWSLEPGRHVMAAQVWGRRDSMLHVDGRSALFELQLDPLESVVLRVGH